jgi:hypothetical protein
VDLHARVYCKRRHPGSIELPQEKAVIEQQRMDIMFNWIMGILKNKDLMDLRTRSVDERTASVIKALGFDPAMLHDPDPVLTGADMSTGKEIGDEKDVSMPSLSRDLQGAPGEGGREDPPVLP